MSREVCVSSQGCLYYLRSYPDLHNLVDLCLSRSGTLSLPSCWAVPGQEEELPCSMWLFVFLFHPQKFSLSSVERFRTVHLLEFRTGHNILIFFMQRKLDVNARLQLMRPPARRLVARCSVTMEATTPLPSRASCLAAAFYSSASI